MTAVSIRSSNRQMDWKPIRRDGDRGKRFINCKPSNPNLNDFLGLPISFGGKSLKKATTEEPEADGKTQNDFKIETEILDNITVRESRIMRNLMFKGVSCTSMSRTYNTKPVKIVIGGHAQKKHKEHIFDRSVTVGADGQVKSGKEDGDRFMKHRDVAFKRVRELKTEKQHSKDRKQNATHRHQRKESEEETFDSTPKRYKGLTSKKCKLIKSKNEHLTQLLSSPTYAESKLTRCHDDLDQNRAISSEMSYNKDKGSYKAPSSTKRLRTENTQEENMTDTYRELDIPAKKICYYKENDTDTQTKTIQNIHNGIQSSSSLSTSKDKYMSLENLETQRISVKTERSHRHENYRDSSTTDVDVAEEGQGPIIANVFSLQEDCHTDMSNNNVSDIVQTETETTNRIVIGERSSSKESKQSMTTASSNGSNNDAEVEENTSTESSDQCATELDIDNLITVTPVKRDSNKTRKEPDTSNETSSVNVVTEDKRKTSSPCLDSPKKSPNENARFKIIKSSQEEGNKLRETASDGCFACDICNMNIFKRKYDLHVHKANYHWS